MSIRAKRWIIILLIAAIAGGAWYMQNANGQNTQPITKPANVVRVAPVLRQDVSLELSAVGTVVAHQSVAIKSRIDSQLIDVKFQDGDYVQKGDLLFVLDDRTLRAQLNQQKANLARDQAQLINSRQQYERRQELAKKGFETLANLDESKAAYDAQIANLQSSKAAVENIEVQLQYTRIVAPISGRTGTINISVGNTVKANDTQALVTINQVKPIRVQASLPQKFLDRVRQAMNDGTIEVAALREGAAQASLGKLEYIDNAVDESTGTFAARALFTNEDEALWPGMFVNLNLKLGQQSQVLTIPENAVQHGQEQDFVFVIAGDKAEKRPIKVERLQDHLAVIESGLKDSEQVTIDGMLTLINGSTVKIVSDTPIPPAPLVKP